MRLTDYVFTPLELKRQYMNTVTMQVGLRYFGGKSVIGKYLLNRIFEMQAYRYQKGNPATVFVDCFTGGGKMALSIPTGWFNTIVMNDMDYGVYSFYTCCKDMPLALIHMIEELGKVMCKDIFMICARNRNKMNGELYQKILDELGIEDNQYAEEGIQLLSAAMTYWVTQSSWLGETDPDNICYALNVGDKNEKNEVQSRITLAGKRILQINERMARQDFIIENMDYVDLIKKYLYDGKGNKI